MKNQRMKTKVGSSVFAKLAIVVLMIAVMVCGLTLFTTATEPEPSPIEPTHLALSGVEEVNGAYQKEYDGTTAVSVSLTGTNLSGGKAENGKIVFDNGDSITATAKFDSKNVNEATCIIVSFTLDGNANDYPPLRELRLPARIVPKTLNWANGTDNASATTVTGTYVNKESVYGVTLTAEQIAALKLDTAGIVGEDAVKVQDVAAATVTGVTSVGTYPVQANVTLSNSNYTVGALDLSLVLDPIEIVSIDWADQYVFAWGEDITDKIEVLGYDAEGNPHQLILTYSEGFETGNAGVYTVTAAPMDSVNFKFASTVSPVKNVTIAKAVFNVSMADVSVSGEQSDKCKPVVMGELPKEIRDLIQYTVDGKPFDGATAFGAYTVLATLPRSENYEFHVNGEKVETLTAKLYINQQYVAAGSGDNKYEIILVGTNGFTGNVSATVTIPDSISKKALKGFNQHLKYTLKVSGAGDQEFVALIPITDSLYHKYLSPLTTDDVYIYESANGKMVKASDKGYTVGLENGYFTVSGIGGEETVTLVIAPEYNPPFFMTAWGIALLIFLALLILLILPFLIGLYLRRAQANEAAVMTVDSGEVEEPVPAEVEDKVDVNIFIDQNVEITVNELADTDAESEPADTEGVEEAVGEALEELTDEAAAMNLEAEETAEAEELADEKAEELADTDAESDAEAEADEEAVRAAVAAALEDINESADAENAILLVAETEEETVLTEDDIKAVIDSIVSDALMHTAVIPESILAGMAEDEDAEAIEEAEAVEEAAEAVEPAAEEAVEETADSEIGEEMLCKLVAESVQTAFDFITVDDVPPAAVEGLDEAGIVAAVENAAAENIPDTWTEDMTFVVKGAVCTELAERLLKDEEEEEAVDAFAVVEEPIENEDDDEDDADDDEDENSFGGFGSMPLTFIDAIAEAEQYAQMLEQEARGEVQLVTRYRRSFQSRLIQSQGSVQDYYNLLKNALLSYKGVKNRVSWNYESFNRGRMHVAKMNAKTRTLYLYLALNPEELADTKYGIVDMSSKKKYATVPVLMKIKGDRKFKYAMELIDKLCGENMTLTKLEREEVDYRLPYQTTEQLVEAGVIKKFVASIPVTVYGAESTEEAPVEEASATAEAQEVSFVEPTTAPAVEAAADDIAADVTSSDEEPKQV